MGWVASMVNLAAFKEFVPGRAMIVVLTLVSLIGAIYLISATNRGEHLTRRNFHNLNAIADNIGASLDTLDAVVEFAEPSCATEVSAQKGEGTEENADDPEKDTKDAKDQTRIAAFANCIKSKLGGVGSSISGGIIRQIRSEEVKDNPDPGGEGTARNASENANEDLAVKPACAPDEEISVKGRVFYINRGSARLKGPIITKIYTVNQAIPGKAIRCLNIIIEYDVLDSDNAREGFFDSTVIANYSTEDDGSDFAKVISNSSSRGVKVSPDDIRQLFNAQSESLRMRTLQELEIAAANERAKAFTLSEDGAAFSSNKDVKSMPFSQSSVTSIKIGGESFYAFIQPLALDPKLKLESDLVIVGLVKTKRFNQDKYGLPYNLLYVLFLLLLTAGLIFSLLHLALISNRELLHRKNSLLANMSILGVQAIAVLILAQAASVSDFKSLFHSSNEGIFNSISAQFNAELEDRYLRLVEKTATLNGTDDENEADGVITSETYRGVENLFLLDQEGTQVGTYMSNKHNPAGKGFKVPDRDYFRQIAQGKGWRYRAVSDTSQHIAGRPYFLDRIESKIDGEISTVLSTTAENVDNKALIPGVLAYTTHFTSLRNTVLPAGFGFAVFDNVSGRVLFHSDQRRSLRENFYQATDDNEELKAKVISQTTGQLELDYKGEKVNAYIGPIKKGAPWTLVAYYRRSVPDAFSFHYGLTGGMLALLLLMTMGVIAAVLVGVLSIALTVPAQRDEFRWRKVLQLPQWMCPLRKRTYEYRLLNLCLVSILPTYAGIFYYTDDWLWLWYFVPPLTALLVWHRLVRYELYVGEGVTKARFPRLASVTPALAIAVIGFALYRMWRDGGELYSLLCCLWLLVCFVWSLQTKRLFDSNKARNGLIVYRRTITLFGLVSAILPTLILLNHNYDIHEQLWVKFNNWATVDRLKARHSYYTRDAEKFRFTGSISQFTLNNWSGVYLPRTEVFSLQESQPESTDEQHTTAERHTWPDLLSADGRGEYYNSYLLARTVDSDDALRENIQFEAESLTLSFFDHERSLHSGLSLPRIVGDWLPNLSDIGSMIESYDLEVPPAPRDAARQDEPEAAREPETPEKAAATKKASYVGEFISQVNRDLGLFFRGSCNESDIAVADDADLKIGKFVDARKDSKWTMPLIRGKAINNIRCQDELKKSLFVERHDQAGISYRILNWYPHTRSPTAIKYIASILVFALVIAGVFYFVNRWLVTRFFTNAFEDGLYMFPPPTKTAHSPLTDGGILVCATGCTLEHFMGLVEQEYGGNYWGDLIPMHLGASGLKQNWNIVRSAKEQTTIAFLDCDELNPHILDPDILERLDRAYRDGDIVIVMTAMDLRYAIIESCAKETESQITEANGSATYAHDNSVAWRAFLSDLPTFFLKLDHNPSRRQMKKGLWDAWKKSTHDEQMVLAGLVYDDSSNPKNKSTLISLYRRSLIRTSNYGFRLSNPDMRSVVKAQCSLKDYRALRRNYENQTWLSWKKPIIVAVTLLIVFVLFIARDQLSGVFSIFATVLTGIATVGLIGERLREFGGALIDKGG